MSAGLYRRVAHDFRSLPGFAHVRRTIRSTPILGLLPDVRVEMLGRRHGITNPSLVSTPEGYAVAARTVPYRLSRLHRRGVSKPGVPPERTLLSRGKNLELLDAASSSVVAAPAAANGRGLEDPRIFRWREAVWLLWTASTPLPGGHHQNSMVMGRLDGSVVQQVIELPSPHGAAREKNWMPLVSGDRLFFVYDLGRGEIYEYRGDAGLVLALRTDQPSLAAESGSSQFIRYRDGWLGVSHHRLERPFLLAWLPVAYYRHRLILLSDELTVHQVSDPFFLTTRNVEFCAGIAEDGDGVVLSLGIEDASAALLRLPRSRLLELLPERIEDVDGGGA